MSIMIRGMKMPTDCTMCPLYADEDYNTIEHCNYGWQKLPPIRNGVPDFCPLVPVPPHGDLIDRDTLKKQGYFFPCAIGTEYAIPLRAVREAPTIIPAEEGGEWLN